VSQPARAKLDRTAIVDAALALLEEVGLDGLSTRTLAAALGVKGPSLYWHIQNMSELRDLMADAVLRQEADPVDPRPGATWRDWMAEGARRVRRAALSHRDGARLIATARPTPRRSQRFTDNIGRLEAAGFGASDARTAFIILSRYALGSALSEQAARGPIADETFEFGLAAMLDGLAARAGAGA
jgi:TetR/AcrR family tetracycline transcriptional repressor